MKTLLAALSLLLLLGCTAVPVKQKQEPRIGVFQNGDIVAAIVDEPCIDPEVKSFIKDEFHRFFKRGKVAMKGVGSFELCWADGEDFADVEPGLKGHILIFDAMGNQGAIPREIFFVPQEKPVTDRTLRKQQSISG